MANGYLAFVLHAHLPFVRHPEHKRHLEERWFYEALIECYLPLLESFDRMADEGVPFALTMSVTPPLAAMLADDLLRLRFEDHLARLEALADREMKRLFGDASFAPIATFYREELAKVRRTWDRHRGDVLAGLVAHWDAGRIELLTCSATHCYLPGLLPAREGIRPQLELGVKGFESLVGRTPRGMWLPECAYHPDFDSELARAGIRYTLVDTHGVLNATPRPPFGVHAPICSQSGVVFFARDAESSRQVWSREEGYPGNVFYRDFYRDIGFDLPEEELLGARPERHAPDDRAQVLPDHGQDRSEGALSARHRQAARVGGRGKLRHEPRRPDASPRRDDARRANRRVALRRRALRALVVRGAVVPRGRLSPAREHERRVSTTLGAYLEAQPACTRATPSASSWGAGGYGEVWVGPKTGWSWRHVHHATRYVAWLVNKYRHADGAVGTALDQAIREALLLQSSDWNFILRTGTQTEYADARIRTHTHRLRHLGHIVQSGRIEDEDGRWLLDVCSRDTFLAGLSGEELRRPFDA